MGEAPRFIVRLAQGRRRDGDTYDEDIARWRDEPPETRGSPPVPKGPDLNSDDLEEVGPFEVFKRDPNE